MKRFLAQWQVIAALLLLPGFSAAQAIWESLEGPEGGFVNSMAVSPDGDLYAVLGWDKLYKTEDHGETWTEIPFPGLDPVHLFILSDGVMLMHAGAGLWRSVNEGAQWSLITSFQFYRLVEAGDGTLFGVCGNGIFRSVDKGLHWSPVSSGNMTFLDLAINDFDEVFVTGVETNTGFARIYKSADLGENWELILESFSFYSFYSIVSLPSGPLLTTGYQFILRSTDGGCSWDTLPNPGIERLWAPGDEKLFATSYLLGLLESENEGNSWYSAGFEGQEVSWVQGDSDQWIYAGVNTRGLARRNGDLPDWEFVNHGIVASTCDVLGMDNYGNLFALLLPNMLYSRNEITSEWTLNNLPFKDCSHFWVSPENKLIISGYDYIAFSSNGGASWKTNDTFAATAMGFSDNGIWYAINQTLNHGLFRSEDKGSTWENITPPMSGFFYFSDLLVTSDNTVLVGYLDEMIPKTQRSVDGGLTWEEVADLSPIQYQVFAEGPGVLYAAGQNPQTNKSNIFKSLDGGISWAFIKELGIWFADLAVNSSGHLFVNNADNILKSSTEGKSWSLYGVGEFSGCDVDVKMLLSSDGVLYVAYPFNGVWRTTESTTPVYEPTGQPLSVYLSPNPVRGEAQLKICLPETAEVWMEWFNAAGQMVNRIEKREIPSGNQVFPISTAQLQPGIYYLHIYTNHSTGAVKMVLL